MNHSPTPDKLPPAPSVLSALFRPWAWRMAWRDSRSQRGRLALYALSIAAGICALSAIHALKHSVQEGINSQAKNLLGADVLVSSRRPVPSEKLASVAHLVRERAGETAFSSMLSAPSRERARLVQVRALEGGYPFGSHVETQPPEVWSQLQAHGGILLEPPLLFELGVSPGETVKMGSLELKVLGTVSKGVPRSNRFSGYAPEVFIRHADLEATGLLGAQSLVNYHAALELTAAAADNRATALAEIRRAFSENGVRVQTPEERQELAGEGLEKAREFLGITALAALVLAGIGVAGAIHSHLQKRLPTVAILLCLGCPTQLAIAIYLVQAAVLGVLGASLGALAGGLAHAGAVHFAGANLPVSVNSIPHPMLLLQAAATGFVLCCGFALLPLLGIKDVPPSATLSNRPRSGSAPVLRQCTAFTLIAALLWALARFNGSSALRALGLTAALATAFSLLAGTALGLMVVARKCCAQAGPTS